MRTSSTYFLAANCLRVGAGAYGARDRSMDTHSCPPVSDGTASGGPGGGLPPSASPPGCPWTWWRYFGGVSAALVLST